MKKLVGTFPKSMNERVFVVRTVARHRICSARPRSRSRIRCASTAATTTRSQAAAVIARSRRRGARHGRRPRLRRKPVQPRDRRAAPARLLVQALCLCHRAGERHQADLDRGRRPGLHRQLVPAELLRRLCRLDDADPRRSRARSTPSRSSCRSRSATAIPRPAAPRSSRWPRAMGIRTPLPDTPSLPIGADEVTVLDHTGGLCDLPERRQGGYAARAARSAHRRRRTGLALRPRRPEAAPGDAARRSRST